MTDKLLKEPLNLIITGVGGQGNVLASQLLGSMLIHKGFQVTIGETYGLSQRGGAVMSQVRISSTGTFGPMIPFGKADLILGLEPLEVLRTLEAYGQPEILIVTNTRPIFPINVLSGEASYPSLEIIRNTLESLSKRLWWVPASKWALTRGNPILTNMVMLGGLSATDQIPITLDDFIEVAQSRWAPKQIRQNIEAFEAGIQLARQLD
jgi:indolepyruvate ferredoxin oxidoreductase, beta subunit